MGKLEKVRSLRKNLSIQQLLDAASEILRNPIAMFDTNYTLIAYTEVVTDDPIWNELVTTGTFSAQMQGFFADLYFTFDVANTEKIVVLKSEHLKYERVLANVYLRNKTKVANLVMVACNDDLVADDLLAFSAFADKITNIVRDDEHYIEYGRVSLASVIVRLLSGEITDTRLYTPHIRLLYDGFDEWFYLAVVRPGESANREFGLEHIRNQLADKYRSFKFAIYDDAIIMLMSSKHETFRKTQVLRNHTGIFDDFDLYAGISSSFENMFQLQKYYEEALALLTSGIEERRPKRIFLENAL